MSYDKDQESIKILKQRYSESSKRTVFFVGSGCSVEVGLPDWNGLAAELFDRLDAATPVSALSPELVSIFNEATDLKANKKYWEFFDIVEKNWSTLYEDFLSERFSVDYMMSCAIPNVYKMIWRMRNVGQVLTLNIDGLIKRAYDCVHGDNIGQLLEFPGISITDSKSYFARNYPIILNLHGIYTQRSTWVMTAVERERLFKGFQNGNYRAFLRHIFESYNIVFIGVNIRDTSISPIIDEISTSTILNDHFWITPDVTADNFRWAQSKGVRVINYSPEKIGDAKQIHSSVICSILQDIESHKSFDKPVILPGRREVEADFPNAVDLLSQISKDPSGVRAQLDGRIEFIGRKYGFESKQVSRFVADYAVPLELSSVIGKEAPYNGYEGLTISYPISESNSSSVWMALDKASGKIFAVKALSGHAFRDSVERESFRRGIESMVQLNTLRNPVAPTFIAHTNTPLAFAMEYIDGASLSDLQKSSRSLVTECWLPIFVGICKALLACHQSDAEVLHRDIKPKNILFEGAHEGCDRSELLSAKVRFINFDMSWHKFSSGNSKSVSAEEVGYYAPEQRNLYNSDGQRTAKTDVYMLGMTFFNLLTSQSPPEGGASVKDWPEHVSGRLYVSMAGDPLLAKRITRLIVRMTSIESDKRPDLPSVVGELEQIGYVSRKDWENADPDIFVEKILIESGYDYEWDEHQMQGRINTVRQIELNLAYQSRGQKVHFYWTRQRDDSGDRRNFGGRLGELAQKIKLQLQNKGWDVVDGGGHHSRSIEASIRVRDLSANPLVTFEHIKEVITKMMSSM